MLLKSVYFVFLVEIKTIYKMHGTYVKIRCNSYKESRLMLFRDEVTVYCRNQIKQNCMILKHKISTIL